MPPQEQEDSPKEPLTRSSEGDVKLKPDAGNGDANITMSGTEEEEEEFRGLTKEELMEYSKSPFWVRLRIFLMFLFWAGWLVMLVLAVLIIIQAPRCEPPPTLLWVQESPLVQVDINQNTPEEITSFMEKLGITSFFIPALISPMDYLKINPTDITYVAETIRTLLEAVNNHSYDAVTDYVPNPVHRNHPWLYNTTLIDSKTLELNYSSPDLEPALKDVFEFWKSDYGVTGFLVSDEEINRGDAVVNLTTSLNENMSDDNIVVSHRTVDLTPVMNAISDPGSFKEFIMDHYEEWTYYKFNPVSAPHRVPSPSQMPPITLCLMTLPGTPLMQVANNLTTFEQSMGDLIRAGVKLRETAAIKFGDTQFVNSTSDNVIAFSRTQKGTPGYAVTVNIGNSEEVVDFSDLLYLPETGTLAYTINGTEEANAKMTLNSISVGPYEGKVVQFVANYD